MKILVVDDDMIIRLVLKKYFTVKNFSVEVSENGKDALDIFVKNQETYDLIITDIMMPIMDGIELAENIKTLNPKVPIIAITAGSLEQLKGVENLFELILNKPVELNKIHEAVIDLVNT